MSVTGRFGDPGSYFGNIEFGARGAPPAIDGGTSQVLSFTQTVVSSTTFPRSATNTIVFVGTAVKGQTVFLTQTLTLTQDASCYVVRVGLATNVLTIISAIALTKDSNVVATNTFVPTDVSAETVSRAVDATDTLVFSEEAIRGESVTVTQTLTFTQDASYLRGHIVSANQTLTLTESATVLKSSNNVANNTFIPTQTATRNLYRNVDANNTLTMTQSSTGIQSKVALSTLVMTDTAVGLITRKANNVFAMFQTGSRTLTLTKPINHVFVPFQGVSVNLSLNRTLAQTLTFVGVAHASVSKAANNTLVMSQTSVAVASKAAKSTLTLTQTVSVSKSINTRAANLLSISQLISRNFSHAQAIDQVLAFDQHVSAHRHLTHTATNTLVMSQDVVCVRTLETITQALVFTQSATVQKVASNTAAQELTFVQLCTVSLTYNRLATNTLVFQNNFIKPIKLGGLNEINIPIAQGIIVKPLIVLQSPTTAITLPPPEFGDTVNNRGFLNIKRTMTGERYVYRRQNPLEKLNYNFIIDRRKAIELRAFILQNNSEVLTMTNWKGEIWKVLLTNSPFKFVEEAFWQGPQGNKSSIALELQGIKLN